jgi:hypothetical protein
MHSDLSVYGLLYVDARHDRHVNINSRQNSIDVYLLCAANCSRSFRRQGTAFKVITNDRDLLTARLARLDIPDLEIVEHQFTLAVPPRIPFFSAHFKLELYDAFGSGNYGDYVALIDIDTLLLRPLPHSEDLAAYDISDQVFPRYGRDVVIRDLEIVAGQQLANGRWYGGEFLMGSATQFAKLAALIHLCWPRYVENIRTAHHLGDEMVLSAALNLYAMEHALADYGIQNNVTRWWSSRTFNQQAPFSRAVTAALLHLPADKVFMSRANLGHFTNQPTLDAYQKYVRRKLMVRSIIPTLRLFNSDSKKFLPTLT